MDCRDIITIEPGRRGGKPTIRGMRITVQDVLDCLAGGMSEAEILADFPELSPEKRAEDSEAPKSFLARGHSSTKFGGGALVLDAPATSHAVWILERAPRHSSQLVSQSA